MKFYYYIQILTTTTLLTLFPIYGEDFLQTAGTLWHDMKTEGRVTLTIEITSLTEEKITEILNKENVGSKVGDYTLSKSDGKIRLTFNSLSSEQIQKLEFTMYELSSAGMKKETNTIRIQPSLPSEFVDLQYNKNEKTALSRFLINLTRNYINPKHQNQMLPFNVLRPDSTKNTNKFSERIMTANYDPSLEELFDDYVYRETLAALKHTKAWVMSIEEVKEKLLTYPVERIKTVIDRNFNLLPYFASLYPNDPLVIKLKENNLITTGNPEFVFKNTGTLATLSKQVLGITNISSLVGAVDHDKYLSNVSGVVEKTLAQLRADGTKARNLGNPLLVRYFLGDPNKPFRTNPAFSDLRNSYKGVTVGMIPADQVGNTPVLLRPNTVVWHSRPFHDYHLLGEFNPGMVNSHLVKVITNHKYFESKFFDTFAPGSIPETHLMSDYYTVGQSVEDFLETLNRKYPEGWVLKGVREQNTGVHLVHDKSDIKGLLRDYRNSDFDLYRKRTYVEMAGQDEDNIVQKLQEHPCYKGWKIAEALKNPDLSIVQKKVPIDKEYRVEAIGGRVLGGGSTVDRMGYLSVPWYDLHKMNTPQEIAEVEKYVQVMLDRMPENLRVTPFTFDIAKLKTGGFATIESNAGPESGFLIDYPVSINALRDFLFEYPNLVKQGKIPKGMTALEQMDFINRHLKEWNLDPNVHYEIYDFKKDRVDTKHRKAPLDPSRYTLFPALHTAQKECNLGKVVGH